MLIVPSTIAAPAAFTVSFYTPALGVNLTLVTAVQFQMLRYDGTTETLTAAIVSATPTELIAQYTFAGGEITTTGAYKLAPQLAVPGGFLPAEPVTMMVTSPFSSSPKLQDQAWVTASSTISGNLYQPVWGIIQGAGNPNGVVVGSPPMLYGNTQGGTGTTFWVKESGTGTNTGWVGY